MSELPAPIAARVGAFADRTAIVDPRGRHTFADLDHDARSLAAVLRGGRDDLEDARVALLCAPGRDFVVGLLGCWHAGAIAVPLHPPHPHAELADVVDDAGATVVVTSAAHRPAAERLAGVAAATVVDVDAGDGFDGTSCVASGRPALMVHTSGTTGRPKGAVHTHGGVAAMVDALVEAWAWTADDRILLVLPLNHVHGIVNVTLCALAAGACCEAPGGFDVVQVWERLASGDLTLFMAVPTVYARLVAAWDQADEVTRRRWSKGAADLRLMVSGSAALPVSTLDRWRSITGQVLLERYGMTELGMVLSNTLARRVPGHVGEPLPGVEVRVVADDGGAVSNVADGEQGELLVRGPQVFTGYWERPDATAAAFVDGWFRTGDVAVHDPEGFRLLGRASIDIIKSGGEKVSALEIEERYRTHPAIADCAVVGLPDEEWGERVAAAIVPTRPDHGETDASLRAWGKERLAPAKVPTRFTFVDELPRNTLGKVVKPKVRDLFP